MFYIVTLNNFNRDLNAEQVLGQYLDKYYYPRRNFTDFERIKDANRQYQGIDTIVTLNNNQLLIDEKGLMSIPKPISTFALELNYLNPAGNRTMGWLYDEHKLSTHYLLCWIKRNDIPIENVKLIDIHYVIAMLVSRELLQNYLFNTYGINTNSISTKVNEILENNKSKRLENLSNTSNSRYHFSNHLPEQPINIVMTKDELIQSGAVESHFLVKKLNLATPK